MSLFYKIKNINDHAWFLRFKEMEIRNNNNINNFIF